MKHGTIAESARKYHYWRGVRTAVIVLSVPFLALMWACNVAIASLMQGF